MQVNHICYIVHIYQICQADLAWNSSLDSLTIHDGGSKSSDQIGKFCGNALPPNKIISSSHQLLLHFKTNFYGTNPGFQIGYHTLSKFYKSYILCKNKSSTYSKFKIVHMDRWLVMGFVMMRQISKDATLMAGIVVGHVL